jgi:ribose transport system substrate-binding protein
MRHTKHVRLVASLIALMPISCKTQEVLQGITTPIVLQFFDPKAPMCSPPSNRQRVIAFAQDNDRQFINGVGVGLKEAAADRNLEFRVAIANNDPKKMIEQVNAWRKEHVGAVVVAPVDPVGLSSNLRTLIADGSYVGAVVPPPAITILNAPQYAVGKAIGDAAVAYINKQFKGQANVVLLTHDSLQYLAPRFTAMRDSLRAAPGAVIVADISPVTVNKNGGDQTMKTVLLANPKIDVVLGADTVVLGALKALRDNGAARNDQFLGGIDGEPEALEEINRGGPYKATVSLASPIFGYAMGTQAADWLEGKSVPQAMDILPKLITAETSGEYNADVAQPKAIYNDPLKRGEYLRMYGNICFDTRDRYLNFPWSSEAPN